MDHLAGPRRDLVVVERREDVLRVAAVDAVAVAVEHQHVEEVRPLVDAAALLVRAGHAAVAADDALPDFASKSTQTSLESTVPCVNGWPRLSVRITTSTR